MRRLVCLVAATAGALAIGASGGAQGAGQWPVSWPGCKSFSSQAQAQAAWERAGRPPYADGDGDGKVCESLSPGHGRTGKAKTTGCSRSLATVVFSRPEFPNIVRHIEISWERGYPRTLRVNRVGADVRRRKLLDGWEALHPQPKGDGLDLDEAPAAMLRSKVAADVLPIPAHENRVAGNRLGTQLSHTCDGAKVRYRFTG